MGGSQALSRSLFSQLIPEGSEGEYYGFYEISDKGTSWLGPLAFGLVFQLTNSYRIGIVSLVVFFVVGGDPAGAGADAPGHRRGREHPAAGALRRHGHRDRPGSPVPPYEQVRLRIAELAARGARRRDAAAAGARSSPPSWAWPRTRWPAPTASWSRPAWWRPAAGPAR